MNNLSGCLFDTVSMTPNDKDNTKFSQTYVENQLEM